MSPTRNWKFLSHLGAVLYGHARVIRLLLEQPNVGRSYQDCDGTSPIHAAARNGHEDIVMMLWRSPYLVNVNCINGMNRKSPLPFVCRRKSWTRGWRSLGESHCGCNFRGICGASPLHKATNKGHKHKLRKKSGNTRDRCQHWKTVLVRAFDFLL